MTPFEKIRETYIRAWEKAENTNEAAPIAAGLKAVLEDKIRDMLDAAYFAGVMQEQIAARSKNYVGFEGSLPYAQRVIRELFEDDGSP